IDRDQLLAAFDAWTQSPDRTMAEVLVGQGALDESGCVVLGDLIRRQQGRRAEPRRQGALAVGIDRGAPAGPSPGSSVAQPMPETVAHVGSPPPAQVTESPDRPAAAMSINERFRIVRPHARGGLGEVFLAIDPELDRQVALKELREYHAHDPTSQARFLLEARLTGPVGQPGIGPGHGLGPAPGAQPEYASRPTAG